MHTDTHIIEPIVEPELPIIDPHHHLWTETHGARYMPDEFLADANDGHNIVATVFVECGSHYREEGPSHLRCVGETEFAESMARNAATRGIGPKLCAGIVAHADLMLGSEVAAVLEAHRAAAPGRLCGIRRMTAWDEDSRLNFPSVRASAGMMSDARFRAGFAELQRRGLVFDAWVYHTQLGELEALARAFPRTTIVLDHTGAPLATGRFADRAAEVDADWKAGMTRLAACPNVVVKLGGLANASCAPSDWLRSGAREMSERARAWARDHYLQAIDLFTPARCMFESNFPVEKDATSYRALWNFFKRLTGAFSAHEREQLFFGTAARTYSLNPAA
jgi:L-fuconolactonase